MSTPSKQTASFFAIILFLVIAPMALTLAIASRSKSSPDALTYGGGTVLGDTTTYAIFWLPRGYRFEPVGSDARYERVLEQFLRDLNGSRYLSVLSQYSLRGDGQEVTRASTFGGSALDTHPFPPTVAAGQPLQQRDVRAELQRVVQAQRWPTGFGSVFLLLTPYGITACDSARSYGCTGASNGPCGTHGYVPYVEGDIIYADLPIAQPMCPAPVGHTPHGDRIADLGTLLLSHQLFDTILNPGGDGWTDQHGREIADKCRNAAGVPRRSDSGSAVVSLHGRRYLVAQLWSNAAGRCVAG